MLLLVIEQFDQTYTVYLFATYSFKRTILSKQTKSYSDY